MFCVKSIAVFTDCVRKSVSRYVKLKRMRDRKQSF